MRTGLCTDPLFALHDTGPGHPERPERLAAAGRVLAGLDLVPIGPRDAGRAELEAVHAPAYLDALEARIAAGETQLDPDTVACRASWRAALRAAGAGLALAEALLEGRIQAGFGLVRPPGHHACRSRAMGFCLLNNVAVLARFLQARGKRVAIVDWDVHHGNGTQDIFEDDPEVGYLSLHQSPLWPFTGFREEKGAGNIRNIPLPPGSGDAVYEMAFDEEVLPWVDERAPDVLLISAGFDAHARDPLANMNLSSEAFGAFTHKLLGRPILSLLEGGYDLTGLGGAVHAHVLALVEA